MINPIELFRKKNEQGSSDVPVGEQPNNVVNFVDKEQQKHQQQLAAGVAAHTTQAGVPHTAEQASPPQDQPVLKTVSTRAGIEQFEYGPSIDDPEAIGDNQKSKPHLQVVGELTDVASAAAKTLGNEMAFAQGKDNIGYYDASGASFKQKVTGRVTSIVEERNKRKRAA